jgi:hypothetical protein
MDRKQLIHIVNKGGETEDNARETAAGERLNKLLQPLEKQTQQMNRRQKYDACSKERKIEQINLADRQMQSYHLSAYVMHILKGQCYEILSSGLFPQTTFPACMETTNYVEYSWSYSFSYSSPRRIHQRGVVAPGLILTGESILIARS